MLIKVKINLYKLIYLTFWINNAVEAVDNIS